MFNCPQFNCLISRITKTKNWVFLLFFSVMVQVSQAQTTVTITNSTIDQTVANTIQGHLNSGTNVIVESTTSITISNNVNILKSSGADASLTFKAQHSITMESRSIIESSTGKLDVVFWSDSDGNGAGDIFFGASNSYADPASIQTGGGNLWLGGGSGTATWNGLTVGDGYAIGDVTRTIGGSFTHTNGITIQSTIINTAGGHIKMMAKGKSGDSPSIYSGGMYLLGTGSMNSGGGDIEITALAQTGTGNKYGLYNLGPYTFAPGAGDLTITGDASASAASSGASFTGRGVFLWSGVNEIVSTGNITLNGVKSSASGTFGIDVRTPITTTGGDIIINGDALNLGSTLSSSDIIKFTANNPTTNTQTITANTVRLLGSSGSYNFNNTSNSVSNLTANTGGVKFINNNNLALQSFSSSGEIELVTLTGDITVNDNINTTSGSAAGDVLLKARGNISLAASKTITTSGGDVILWSDSDASGTTTSAGGTIALLNASTITTTGGNIVMAGGADANADGIPDGYAMGAYGSVAHSADNATSGLSLDNAIVNAGAGNVLLRGQGTGSANNFQIGTRLYGGSITGADVTIDAKGSILGASSSSWGLSLEGFSIVGSGDIKLTGVGGRAGSTNEDVNQVGVEIRPAIDNSTDHSQISATGTGTIVINGQGGSGDKTNGNYTSPGVRIQSSQTNPILSVNGNILLNGTSAYSGRGEAILLGSPISSTNGNITFKGNKSITGTLDVNGDIKINSTLTTGATVRIETSGAVTQTGAITANALSLNGTGTFTLNNTSNNISVLYGGSSLVKLGSVSFTDASGGLSIVDPVQGSGITASGTVLIETLAGDITLIENIATDNTTANAILINAGKSAAIGTATGGNIIVSGSPTITKGTGGIAKLFSGSEASSTGLTTLVGGAFNKRFSVDETSSSFSPVLAANSAYALYRQAVVVVAPVITTFTPTTAGNGQTVVITGTGFSGVSIVKFGNENATSFVVDSDTQITAVVGAARSGDVLVENTAGSDTATGFTFKIVEYGFEGNALDETDANLDATVTGTATYGPGASGQAICFTNTVSSSGVASTNYLTLPSALLSSRTAFTVSLRFKTTSEGGLLGYQNRAGNVTPTNWVPIIYINQEGKLSGNLWIGSILNVTSPSRVDDGNWHKVEFAVTSTSITIYLDGVALGSANGVIQHLDMTFNQLGASHRLNWPIGNTSRSWVGFNGCIDEFVIVDRGLSLSEITQLTQLPQPTISSFAPTTAKSGETVTITGTNLGSTSSVKLGGVEARSFTVVSATEVKAIVAKDATVNTTVNMTTAAGSVSASTFTFDCTSNAIDFDGTNDHIIVGDQLENLGAFTQEAWVFWKGSSLDYSEIFTKEKISAFAITNTNKLHANFGNGSSWGTGVNSTTSVPLNVWTHVAVTRSLSGQVKLYINGVLDASTGTNSLTGVNGETRMIGSKFTNNTLFGSFKGAIDELKAWNNERTATQIVAGMGAELVGNESGLLAYYNFNQGTADGTNTAITTLNNLTATANLAGTLTNLAGSGSTSNFVGGVWPVIIIQPSATATFCGTPGSLSVSAVGPQLTYQWYSNTSASNSAGTAIAGQTTATLTIPDSATGTQYFYVVVTGACSQLQTSTVSTVTITPNPVIAYSANYSLELAVTMTNATPTSTGGAVAGYAISPALPSGLALNVSTGVISGTPTAVSASRTYTVTGTIAGCVGATTTFTLEVTDATCSTFAAADFKINGGTTYSNNVYTLTPDLGGQNGSVWNQNRVYLDQDFDFKTKVFLGSNDAGADGIAFVLQNQSLSAGSSGGGLGYAGITPSFAVEFDTYQNAGDPAQDHIALIANGNTGANHSTYTPVHEVQMEDGQWHTARFIWDASAKNFQVWYDGVRIHNATIDLKADIFNGRPYVYWGMTGATGGAKNLQQVEFESYCYVQQVSTSALAGTNNTAASLSFCTGATVRLQASASASYQWYKDGVAINGATARELEASASGAYTVESVSSSTQISTTSEVATVTVNPLPAFTYSSTYSFERTKAITTVSPTSTGGAVASYAISATLPAGLSFNTTTGRISGTPTALSAAVTYTVTGTSASSCVSTTTFSLEVFNAVIPSALSYSPSTQTVRAGTAITVMTPTSSGGAVGTYTISPALPAGLSINATTGIISGTLTQAQTGSITYTVTATNTGGSTTAEITLVFNTAPTNLALSPASVDENKASGSSTGTLSSTDIDSGDTHTYALVSGTGSTDNALFTIDGANLKTAAIFDFETKSSYTVRVRTTDAGGLSFEKAITVTVLDVNDAPTNLALSATTINENNAIGAIIGALSSTDVDAGDTFTYTLVSGTGSTDNASFTIDGANLKAKVAFDFETKSSYTVRVRTTDAGGLTYEKAITITVININDAPTNLALSTTSINENNAIGAIIGELSSTDQDAGDTHSYTLVSGTGSTDNALFSIDGANLKAKVAFDFETKSSYTVRVRTTDAGGLTYEKAITITVININDAPTNLALSTTSINENNAVGAIIGELSSTDQDAGDTHSYTLVSGTGSTDNASFSIDGNYLKAKVAFDFETKSSYTVRVRTTDAGGLSFEKAITITVININDAPTDLALSSVSIYENNAVNAIIGNLSSTDQDAGDKHTYTLVSGDVAAFKVSGTQLLANAAYVHGTKNIYDIVVKTTDAGGLSVNKAIRITILQSPVLTASANLARNNQSSAVGQNVTISKGYSANLNLSASGIVKYAWSPATGLSATNISNPIARPTQTTTYTVRVTNAQGISTDVFITVTVLEDYNITPNNVLSPDGDGVNDFWTIENLSTYPNNEVKIFDKAGRIIFNVKNYQNSWNGQLNGATLHEGAYYYIINLGPGTRPKVGYITLFSNK